MGNKFNCDQYFGGFSGSQWMACLQEQERYRAKIAGICIACILVIVIIIIVLVKCSRQRDARRSVYNIETRNETLSLMNKTPTGN